MALVKQLSIQIENKPGTLAQLCTELARYAVNIAAIMAPEVKEVGTVRLVVSSIETARRVLNQQGLKYTEQDVIALKLTDRPGALGRATRKLAERGINVDYAYGSIVKGATRAMIILGVSDPEKAANIVK